MVSLRPIVSNTESDYHSLFFSENGYFWLISYLQNCLSYEVVRPLILIRKLKLWGGGGGDGGNSIEVQRFEYWELLRILWTIRRGNVYIFIIYYRTINQKDKLLYIELEKSMSFSLSTKTEI